MLGGREPSLVLSEVVQRQNYVALWRMLRRYPGWSKNLGRYFFGWGRYPYRCRVRTPQGEVAPTLHSHHDIWTVNEVFCREDYAAGPDRPQPPAAASASVAERTGPEQDQQSARSAMS